MRKIGFVCYYSSETYTSLYQDFLTKVVRQPALLVASELSCTYTIAVAYAYPELCAHFSLVNTKSVPLKLWHNSYSGIFPLYRKLKRMASHVYIESRVSPDDTPKRKIGKIQKMLKICLCIS